MTAAWCRHQMVCAAQSAKRNRNWDIVHRLRDSIWDLEKRAADRHGRDLRFQDVEHEPDIENEPVCSKCGHIGCKEAI